MAEAAVAENVLDLSALPAVVTIVNSGKRAMVSISGINQKLPIENGQTVKLRAETSSELIGYLSQETDTLTVTFAKVTA